MEVTPSWQPPDWDKQVLVSTVDQSLPVQLLSVIHSALKTVPSRKEVQETTRNTANTECDFKTAGRGRESGWGLPRQLVWLEMNSN